MKLGFVYAGQGSQKVGMAKSWYDNYATARTIMDSIDLDIDIKKLCFEGPIEELSKTSNTQPCMVAVAGVATALLKEQGIVPDMVCGLSLGEYSALQCAGVWDINTAVSIVRFRGLAMEKAAAGIDSQMVAIIGLDRTTVERIVEKAQTSGVVQVANYNCPGQVVIGGYKVAVEEASKIAKGKGARRVIPLATSGPFHTSLLQSASDALHDYFSTVTFKSMQLPVIFNSTARPLQAGHTIAQMLEKQVMSPVYLEDSIRYMIDQEVDTIIEIGPGKVLSGFIKKIDKTVRLFQVEDKESLEKTIEGINNEKIAG